MHRSRFVAPIYLPVPRRYNQTAVRTSILLGVLAVAVVAQDKQAPRRIAIPTWDESSKGIFFDDAFTDALRGKRPDSLNASATTNDPTALTTIPPSSTGPANWSSLISAVSIEDELKAIHRRSTSALRTEGHFRGRGSRELHPHFATAAFLFAIIENYDGDVRWQDSAAAGRRLFAQTTIRMRRPDAQSYREAKQRQQELFDLIRGGSLEAKGNSQIVWADIVDRSMMMKRLDIALKETLSRGTASEAELADKQSELMREAEVTAAIAHALTQEGMEGAEDDDYDSMCKDLVQAARELYRAASDNQLDAAKNAEGAIRQSCDSCHEIFR